MTRPFVKRDTFLPFSRPTIRQVEIDEVVDTLRSGWITTGPKAERFEKDFAAYVGAPEVLAVSSATGGLHIGLIALELQPGDEVIITPMTWAATSNMVEVLGGKSVFVEIDPDTLQIDPEAVEAAVSRTLTTPQVPATLPTLDEALGDTFTEAPAYFSAMVKEAARSIWPVFTLHSELEGGPYTEDFRAFLRAAKATGLRCVPLGELLAERQRQGPLPACTMHHAPVRGRHGVLSTQGPVGSV